MAVTDSPTLGGPGVGLPVADRLAGVLTPDVIPLTLPATVRLTPREREIAVLAANGVGSQEIAASLVLSVRTVDNHLQNVYRKLGTRSRRKLRRVLGRARAGTVILVHCQVGANRRRRRVGVTGRRPRRGTL